VNRILRESPLRDLYQLASPRGSKQGYRNRISGTPVLAPSCTLSAHYVVHAASKAHMCACTTNTISPAPCTYHRLIKEARSHAMGSPKRPKRTSGWVTVIHEQGAACRGGASAVAVRMRASGGAMR